MTGYAPRTFVHPDRYGATRTGPLLWLIVHTSEGLEGVNSAENLAAFLAQPGDRPSSSGGFYGASYHYLSDTDDSIPAVPDNVVAFSAAGANAQGIHFCIPGKAGQTRAQWLDQVSRAAIRETAWAMADRARVHRIPLARLTPANLIAGRAGYCGHADVSLAFHLTDHTDPGANFPWDVLALDLAAYANGGPVMLSALELREGRILDTRIDGDRSPFSGERVVACPDAAGAPAVEVTLTATEPAGPGFVTAWATGPRPTTSDLNFAAGQTIANTTVVRVSPDGSFRVFSPTPTHLVVDLKGIWQP